MDRNECERRLLIRRAAAFPSLQGGRRPPRYFRGLLRIHSRYGPRIRSRAFRPFSSRGFATADYSAASLGSYGVEPTTSPAELSSAGHQRLFVAHCRASLRGHSRLFSARLRTQFLSIRRSRNRADTQRRIRDGRTQLSDSRLTTWFWCDARSDGAGPPRPLASKDASAQCGRPQKTF